MNVTPIGPWLLTIVLEKLDFIIHEDEEVVGAMVRVGLATLREARCSYE